MIFTNKNDNPNVFKSVLMAYFILLLHVSLIGFLGILVIFFSGIVNYMVWIFLAASAAILLSGYFFYKRMKEQGKTFREMIESPLFSGRAIEVSFLGGFASLKLGKPAVMPMIENSNEHITRIEDQIEKQPGGFVNELTELMHLLEKNLITLEEYNIAKKQLFK
ncbi:MAG: hypothetical protein JJV89_04560 [Desulfosarcina sp.]|nr:hypothetical protein [Desulfobacterales bacterium]